MGKIADEARIEAKLRRKVRARGGLVLKWVSPGTDSVPDDLVFPGDGSIHLVETKRTAGRLRKKQEIMRYLLGSLMVTVWVINSDEELERFLLHIYPNTNERI